MLRPTDDLRIEQIRPLIPPAILMENLPLSEKASTTVAESREAVARVLRQQDDRLVVVVGPCSIHDVEAARDYARGLQAVAAELADALVVVMRVYFEKPRTTVGWKGLINDPRLDGTFRVNEGLNLARGLLLDLAEMGVPAGCEFLDTITPQYIADVVSWGAIGARTTESQVHRELASGLSVPVGFKNGTDGNIQIAIDAIQAAGHPHHFLSVTKQGLSAIVATRGNPDCHLILRGGNSEPNYDAAAVARAIAVLEKAKLPARLMIDCSHGNSRKDPARQPAVASDIAGQIRAGGRTIAGVMIESHLVGGRQDATPGKPLTRGPEHHRRLPRVARTRCRRCASWRTPCAPAAPSVSRPARAFPFRAKIAFVGGACFDVPLGEPTMVIRIIYLPSGGLAETHGSVVRLTTPSAGRSRRHRLTRREIQEATSAEARPRWGASCAGDSVAGRRQARDDAIPAGSRPRAVVASRAEGRVLRHCLSGVAVRAPARGRCIIG
jgi:3-deoxy-7-phosphoheptulonate synthase